ncbi:MAG: cell division protein ZapB [Acidobacteria bacterium]|nr:cell division protein ZapB [Acidobacteriota bacterium]
MMKTPTALDLGPIERLEAKIKQLVAVLEHLRQEQAELKSDNARLLDEVSSLTGRLAEAEQAGGEVAALRAERAEVRARVAEMLEQLEAVDA